MSHADAILKRAAIDHELGHPTRGTNVGAGPHVVVSETFTPGAPGWTESECAIDDANDGTGRALLTLTARAVALGKRDVVLPDQAVVPVDLTVGVIPEKPPRYRGPT